MELPGLGRLSALLSSVLVLALATPASARPAVSTPNPGDSATPVLVVNLSTPPPGFRLTAKQVRAIAAADPRMRTELARHPTAMPYVYTKGAGHWQVSWFAPGPGAKELAIAYVDDATARVTEAWTGFQVRWTMARGYPGAFGRHVNAWYVWLPLCLAFALPFLRLPRGPGGRRRPTLVHLDVAVLLAFSISLAFFNHGTIGLSVPLVYPCLLYLLGRMLLLAAGRGRPREALRLLIAPSWLLVGIVFLVSFRVGLNVSDSNVIDVGYAGVIGADRILHGEHLYGRWPSDNPNGNTYGPAGYLAYVPFRAALGWSGTWDDLPAAHGAAIAFDLLTMAGLFLLGRMIRGPDTGIVLAYAWAAYPFTLYTLNSNSNDSLVALLLVAALLVLRWAPARGAAAVLGGLTKFAPLALAPLLLRGVGRWPGWRASFGYLAGFLLAGAAAFLPVLLAGGGLRAFWQDTVVFQLGRGSPFSIWGLWGGLSFEQHLVQGGVVALALAVAVVPRRRGIVELAALGAAVLIAFQLALTHWFYLYIPWFFPLVMVALLAAAPRLPPGGGDPASDSQLAERRSLELATG